ncbi:MAG: methylmalonate-semialdehyde dehydrogenase (CoA acylating), partial [Pseudomonadales bacterium]
MAHTEITGHFIGGKSDVSGSQKLERLDPATGEQMGYVMLADEKTVNAAVDASKIAYQEWR